MKWITDYLAHIGIPIALIFGLAFTIGYFTGRASNPPIVVKYVTPEREEPIRRYIISQRKAGMDEWIHIRVEEYPEDIDFVEKRWDGEER